MFNKKGFTLVELMIVVAIIGILAAIAIPNFVAMQYRAKRAEVPPNLDGIKTAELAYDAAQDQFVVEGTFRPRDAGEVDKAQVTWDGGNFDALSWAPDGKVRGAYKVTTTSTTDFLVEGVIDVDNDEENAEFTCSKETNVVMVSGNDVY